MWLTPVHALVLHILLPCSASNSGGTMASSRAFRQCLQLDTPPGAFDRFSYVISLDHELRLKTPIASIPAGALPRACLEHSVSLLNNLAFPIDASNEPVPAKPTFDQILSKLRSRTGTFQLEQNPYTMPAQP